MINDTQIWELKDKILEIEKEAITSVNKVMDVQIVERIKKVYEEMTQDANK